MCALPCWLAMRGWQGAGTPSQSTILPPLIPRSRKVVIAARLAAAGGLVPLVAFLVLQRPGVRLVSVKLKGRGRSGAAASSSLASSSKSSFIGGVVVVRLIASVYRGHVVTRGE